MLATFTNKATRFLQLGLGYGLSMRSQKEWAQIERAERAEQEAIKKAQKLIEWAHAEYVGALEKHKRNLKVYAELTLNWSPERVLSTHKEFGMLCRLFQSERMWKKLSRKERKFIAEAVSKR